MTLKCLRSRLMVCLYSCSILMFSSHSVFSATSEAAKPYSAAGHDFTLQKVAEVSGELWSMAFLPDGKIIATQKRAGLLLIEGGKSGQLIIGLPKAVTEGQAGYFDVKLDPNYSKNKLIYIAYSAASSNGFMTKVDRGRLDGLKWVHSKTVFSAPESFHIKTHHHFGGRIAFAQDAIFLSVGDRGQRPHAQNLNLPNGKIHRLNMNGGVPKDNPFMAKPNKHTSIWSYGHRNPQGMAVHPVTDDLWVAEHGPKGGDEINLIEKGKNYGWPIITYGTNYDGTSMTKITQKEGMEQPKHYWVPSIAVSGIEFYTGQKFSKWNNQLLVGSLAKQELRLLKIKGDVVVEDSLLLKGLGRIRDVVDGPDGYPYFTVLGRNGKSTLVYRLSPAT